MKNSQNGWSAITSSDDSRLKPFKYITGRIRTGVTTQAMTYLCEQFNKRVERIAPSESWGYNYRTIRGASTSLSNHSSGTAIDLNATKHPLGAKGTFNSSQVKEIHAILKELSGIIRWGGDYSGRKDEMHFEINASESAVKNALEKLGKAPVNTSTTNKNTKNDINIKKLQKGLNETFPAYSKLTVDGIYGTRTKTVVKEFQKRSQLYSDGIVGDKTIAALKKYGINV